MPLPTTQREYVLRTPTVAYQSVWSTPEQQKSQYSPVVTKYARTLPDTPMTDWQAKSGTYRIASPYTLGVPTAYPEAVNINTLEYLWAQGLIVALHSLRYAYKNTSSREPMPFIVVAKQLDTNLFAHNLLMVPPSDYYMANCRTLHSEEVTGPTAVSGWKRYVSSQPFVQSRNILIIMDSGTEINGKSGKSHHSIVSDLRQHCGYANIHTLT
jgi:hypothetical protein